MKIIVFALIGLFSSTHAFARIGETLEQLNKRYGRPVQAKHQGIETYRYSFRGFSVLVGLEQGRSQCEIYQKADRSRMSEAEILGLLEVNAGTSPWSADPDESLKSYTYWSQDKKTRVAIYDLSGHSLIVTSKPFLPRLGLVIHSDEHEKMEGF
jgi:hypothetical protein